MNAIILLSLVVVVALEQLAYILEDLGRYPWCWYPPQNQKIFRLCL